MSLINEETLAKFPVNNDLMKIFSDKTIKDMPDLARSYLFQLIYTNGTVEYYDLMLKTRKVDFDEDGKGITVQFDEFQDFRVWSTLNELVRNKDILNIKMNFYDSNVKKVLYTHELNNVVCHYVYPINMDTHTAEILTIKAHFHILLGYSTPLKLIVSR